MRNNSSYSTASPIIKILAWLTVLAFGFTLFNLVMFQLDYIIPDKIFRELCSHLQNGIPFFFFLTGTFICNKILRIPLWIFFTVFIICFAIQDLNYWDVVDITGKNWEMIRWTMGISLTGLFLVYLIHFFMDKAKNLFSFTKEQFSLQLKSPFMNKLGKSVLDLLKLGWFFCIGFAFICIKFPIGFHGLLFFNLSIWFFVFLMAVGLFRFFRKSSV